MSKNDSKAADVDVQVEVEQAVTLPEFCTRLSMTDKRVELIGGFEYSERASMRVKDTETAYRARFQAFTTKPV